MFGALVHPRRLFITLGVVGWSSIVIGQNEAPKPSAKPEATTGRNETSVSEAEDHGRNQAAHESPTAEDVLKALQRERPSNSIIPPQSVVVTGESFPVELPKLLPEGTSLVDQSGAIRSDGERWEFVFDEPAAKAMPLLPNTTLEVMVRTTTAATRPVRFTISGEVTVFRGENHLIPRTAVRAAPGANDAPPTPNESTPGSERAPQTRSDAAPADVVATLINERPARPILSPGQGRSLNEERGEKVSRLVPEGTRFANRPGRVVKRGDAYYFLVETDSNSREEPVLTLLPCAITESIIKLAERDDAGLVFIVSGEVTTFDGANYLLPRVAMRRMISDNLRK